jgi:flavin-dependent dehydrogenase
MYDAIIVGARCAGSSTAMLLARNGYRVLLVDKAFFPSDLEVSTHLVWQAGAARLQRWDLLDEIWGSNCPPIKTLAVDLGPFALTGSPPSADGLAGACSPRRTLLDKILVDAAAQAGAEIREGFVVQELVQDDQIVRGIVGAAKGGSPVTETARLVIGADGMNSTVARSVAAPKYNAKPRLQGTYFTYWSGVPMNRAEFYIRDGRAVYGWMTNHGQTLIGINWAAKDFPAVRSNLEREYLKVLGACAPALAERVRGGGKREEQWRGGSIASFFRKSYGPGWALVGDAGLTIDPCTAAGITNAFRDAELLAEAIDQGYSGRQALDDALADYQRRRDEAAMPVYEFACQLAPFASPPPEMQQLFAALHGNQTETNRFIGLFAQTVPIPEFFAPENRQRIIASANCPF